MPDSHLKEFKEGDDPSNQNPCPECGAKRRDLEASCEACDWTPRSTHREADASLPDAPRVKRPIQFQLSHLLQLLVVVGLWCSAGLVKLGSTAALAYFVITCVVTWTVAFQFARQLSVIASRRLLAAIMSAMIVGTAYLSLPTSAGNSISLVLSVSVWISFAIFATMQGLLVGGFVGFVLAILIIATILWLGWYLIWSIVIWIGDSLCEHPAQFAIKFSIVIAALGFPLFYFVVSDCFLLTGHDGTFVSHHWQHCLAHLGMFVATIAVVIYLLHPSQHCEKGVAQVKYISLGYLCLYAVLAQSFLYVVKSIF